SLRGRPVELPFVSIEFDGPGTARRRKRDPSSRGRHVPRSERKRWLGMIGAGLAFLFMTIVGGLFLTGRGPQSVELPAWLPIARATWRPEDSIHLKVSSEPEQATVILDGRERGKTPLAVQVAPGTHSLALRHADRIEEQRQLSVSSDLSVDVAL